MAQEHWNLKASCAVAEEQSIAELLLDHDLDQHDEAVRHRDTAIPELRDMKMQPALGRALARRESIGD